MEGRFGIPPQVSSLYTLWERGGTSYILSAAGADPEPWAPLRVASVGLPLLRQVGSHLKPTSVGLRLLSPWITRNRLSLTDQDAWLLLRQGFVAWPWGGADGYVLMELRAGVLGCGLLLGGTLRSQIPKSEVASLALGSGPDGPPHPPG